MTHRTDNSLSSNRISFGTYGDSITSNTRSIPTVSMAQLPPEAIITIKHIEKGGPFPFPNQDGTTFLNREGKLPSKPYKDYTILTLGVYGGRQHIVSG